MSDQIRTVTTSKMTECVENTNYNFKILKDKFSKRQFNINTKMVKDELISSEKFQSSQILEKHFYDSAITNDNIQTATIKDCNIKNNTIKSEDLSNNPIEVSTNLNFKLQTDLKAIYITNQLNWNLYANGSIILIYNDSSFNNPGITKEQ